MTGIFDGGGGGSRTPVRRLFTPGYYVRFRSFDSRPRGPRPAGFPSDHPGLDFALPPPGRGIRAIPLGRRPSAYTGNRRSDVRGALGRVSVAIVVGDYWFPLLTRSAGPRHATREHRRPRRNRFAPVLSMYHFLLGGETPSGGGGYPRSPDFALPLVARSMSRFASRAAMSSRLSYSFLPRASPIASFTCGPFR